MKMTREDYKEQVEAQLGVWAAKLENLQASEKAVVKQRNEIFLADIAELKKLEVAGKQVLASFETSADTSWDEMKIELTDKWNQVSGGFDAVWARFK